MEQEKSIFTEDKPEMYELLKTQLAAFVEGETHIFPILSNGAALLYYTLKNINWAGFYLMINGELLLGPFQGKPACVHIAIGRGVCGTAVLEDKTQLVADVHQFSGHIACDSTSNSEIVIPLHDKNGTIVGVLDIDSPDFARFDEADQKGLETFVSILEATCDWSLIS